MVELSSVVEIGGRFVAEIVVEICGFVFGFFGLWVSFSNFSGFEIYGFFGLWVSFSNFYGFKISRFVFGFLKFVG